MTLLECDPGAVLQFKRPFTAGVVKATLRLRNTSSEQAAVFKIKTTAPKQYCVRPNAGLVPPQQTRDIHVLLQQMKEDPPQDFKCKDKFLVQAVPVPASFDSAVDLSAPDLDLWAVAELKRIGDLVETKLRVVFLPATANDLNNNNVNNVNNNNVNHEPSTLVAQPSSASVEPERSATTASTTTIKPQTKQVEPASPSSATLLLDKQLQDTLEELKRYQALCDRYQKELANMRGELRHRTNATVSSAASDDSKAKPESQATQTAAAVKGPHPALVKEDFSLTIVLLVAVVSFLIGALLF